MQRATLGRAGSLLFIAVGLSYAQDLAPRAYVITPIHSNAVTFTYSFYDGNIIFDGTVPITGASARVNVPVFSFFHSFRLFGRTASFVGSLPTQSVLFGEQLLVPRPKYTARVCWIPLSGAPSI